MLPLETVRGRAEEVRGNRLENLEDESEVSESEEVLSL